MLEKSVGRGFKDKMPARKLAVVATGKRKTAVARAVLRPGSGEVKINNIPIEIFTPEIARLKILEPLNIAGDITKQVNIDVTVHGGGYMGQAEATRMSIARGLINWTKSIKLKKALMSYDRSMVSGDSRIKEMKRFGGPGARRRRQKSYR